MFPVIHYHNGGFCFIRTARISIVDSLGRRVHRSCLNDYRTLLCEHCHHYRYSHDNNILQHMYNLLSAMYKPFDSLESIHSLFIVTFYFEYSETTAM